MSLDAFISVTGELLILFYLLTCRVIRLHIVMLHLTKERNLLFLELFKQQYMLLFCFLGRLIQQLGICPFDLDLIIPAGCEFIRFGTLPEWIICQADVRVGCSGEVHGRRGRRLI